MQAACCAVKRINLDMRVAKNAQRNGVDLKEGFEVSLTSAGHVIDADSVSSRLTLVRGSNLGTGPKLLPRKLAGLRTKCSA